MSKKKAPAKTKQALYNQRQKAKGYILCRIWVPKSKRSILIAKGTALRKEAS
jgi:hypothetical protein